MFEKEAEEYANGKGHEHYNYLFEEHAGSPATFANWCFKDGAEFGYNKAKEDADKMKSRFLELCNLKDVRIAELEKANEWHEDLPTEDVRLAIIEVEDCGYLLCNYRNGFWYNDNSGATCAEWITRNIKRWKEIVLLELKESE